VRESHHRGRQPKRAERAQGVVNLQRF